MASGSRELFAQTLLRRGYATFAPTLGLRPGDPVTFASIAGIAALVAVLANLVPALRAIRVDPVQALRQ